MQLRGRFFFIMVFNRFHFRIFVFLAIRVKKLVNFLTVFGAAFFKIVNTFEPPTKLYLNGLNWDNVLVFKGRKIFIFFRLIIYRLKFFIWSHPPLFPQKDKGSKKEICSLILLYKIKIKIK